MTRHFLPPSGVLTVIRTEAMALEFRSKVSEDRDMDVKIDEIVSKLSLFVRQLGDRCLREVSETVPEKLDSENVVLRECLTEALARVRSLYPFRSTAGIGAPQLGFSRRVFAIWSTTLGVQVWANPAVRAQASRSFRAFEGCLSFFDRRGEVDRPTWIRVGYFDLTDGKRKSVKLTGDDARIFLHETDHLDGILYTDRMADGCMMVDYEQYRRIRPTTLEHSV